MSETKIEIETRAWAAERLSGEKDPLGVLMVVMEDCEPRLWASCIIWKDLGAKRTSSGILDELRDIHGGVDAKDDGRWADKAAMGIKYLTLISIGRGALRTMDAGEAGRFEGYIRDDCTSVSEHLKINYRLLAPIYEVRVPTTA